MSTCTADDIRNCSVCGKPSRLGSICDACRALGIHEEATRDEMKAILERKLERDWASINKQMRDLNFTRALMQITDATAGRERSRTDPNLGVALIAVSVKRSVRATGESSKRRRTPRSSAARSSRRWSLPRRLASRQAPERNSAYS